MLVACKFGIVKVGIERKQSYYLEVWPDNNGVLIFSDATGSKSFPELKNWWDYKYTVHGQNATVYLFFGNCDIQDKELLRLAIQFMKGDYVTYEIDLKHDTVKSFKGVSKIAHPHQ